MHFSGENAVVNALWRASMYWGYLCGLGLLDVFWHVGIIWQRASLGCMANKAERLLCWRSTKHADSTNHRVTGVTHRVIDAVALQKVYLYVGGKRESCASHHSQSSENKWTHQPMEQKMRELGRRSTRCTIGARVRRAICPNILQVVWGRPQATAQTSRRQILRHIQNRNNIYYIYTYIVLFIFVNRRAHACVRHAVSFGEANNSRSG